MEKHKLNGWLEYFSDALTSYFFAFLGMASTEAMLATLGAIALIIRVIYDAIKLYRYIKDPDHKG